jgi:hypothetical protein
MRAAIILIIVFGYYIWACFLRGRSRKVKYTEELSQRIQKINYINSQIIQIDKLLVDVELSDREHHHRFSFERQTLAGEEISADIWVDGNSELSEQTYELLKARKKELLVHLFGEIYKLPKQRHTNVIQTYDIYGRGEDVNVQ